MIKVELGSVSIQWVRQGTLLGATLKKMQEALPLLQPSYC